MRLLELNEAGQPSLTKNFITNIPQYAILSHTWGADEDEVTFQDLTQGSGKEKKGYKKIEFCTAQAARDGLKYCWVDTCCINKADFTELNEAINSMFEWYQKSVKCYVYLSDVQTHDANLSAFRASRWHTRGWTLQELIAPRSVEFFSTCGTRIGDKFSLEKDIHEVTGIAKSALQGTALSRFSFDERMSWADGRNTTREEDRIYSLLGFFGVHFPLLYGEKVEGAMGRLAEEINKRSKKHQLEEPSPNSETLSPSKRVKLTQNNNIDHATKDALVEQLYFDKIDERLTSLPAAQGTTCRWFLAKPEYESWHDIAQQSVHGGFLWIKGNPGTGKSTLMKLLFEKAFSKARHQPSQITLSFFFLARGTLEERSTIGLYRSLLHQLFQTGKDLEDSLEWITQDGAKVIQRDGWNEESLKQTLGHAIERLADRSLMIFVDALDECDETQTGDLVGFFEDLCDRAEKANVRLQICFSSRHYPTITVQRGIEVILEDEVGHTSDIEQYIKAKLRIGKMKKAETFRSEILDKSSGIFLWVVLVVDILNTEHRNGSASTKIRDRLKELPPGLHDLFEMILGRDKDNLECLEICLRWILFAARPLKPQEIYFAIQFGLKKECSGYWDDQDIDLDQMKTFVRSSSKGLAEITRNKSSEVQFIHESVRDFLFGRYDGQRSEGSVNFAGDSHELLRDCCMAQLNAPIGQHVEIPDPLPPARDPKGLELRQAIDSRFPFLEYAINNLFFHANGAQRSAIDQSNFLVNFPLQRWILLNNALESHEVRRCTESASTLYLFAEKNLPDLIRIDPLNEYCFEVSEERYGPPILAAIVTSSHQAVHAFLEIQARIHPDKPELSLLCRRYIENRNKPKNSRNFAFSRKESLFGQIVEQGDEVILDFLNKLELYKSELTAEKKASPMIYLAGKGHAAGVKTLIHKGFDVNIRDGCGRTLLSGAAETNFVEMVKVLLDNGAEINAQDYTGRSALFYAVMNGHQVVVKLLLEKGAKVNIRCQNNYSPLIEAVLHPSGIEVVKHLLDAGAEINAKTSSGKTALHLAAGRGYGNIVKLLLDKGAEVNIRDGHGCSPLHIAIGLETVKLLLDAGAEIDGQADFGETVLHKKIIYGREDIVKLLLERGASISIKDNQSRTALDLARTWGRSEIVEILENWPPPQLEVPSSNRLSIESLRM